MGKWIRAAFGLALVLGAIAGSASARCADTVSGVPEVDAGTMLNAVTLLTGGVLVLTSRIRRK